MRTGGDAPMGSRRPVDVTRDSVRVGCHVTQALLLALLVLLAGACGSVPQGGSSPTATPDSPLAHRTVYSVEGGVLTAARLSDGALQWRYPKPVAGAPATARWPAMLAPVVADGTVYGGDLEGTVFALRAGDGEKLWQTQLDNPTLRLLRRGISEYTIGYDQVPIQAAGGLLYVTPMALRDDQQNDLFALSQSDGSIRWHYPLRFGSPPLLDDGVAYVGATVDDATQGEVLALDAATGARLWSVQLAACPTPEPLATADGLLYVGTCNGTDLVALRATSGAIVWRTRTQANVSYFDGASVAGGVVVASNSSGVFALDAQTGALRWSHNLRGSGGPLATEHTVYVGTADRCYDAFDNSTGAVQWRTSPFAGQPCVDPPYPNSLQQSTYTAPILADGMLCMDAALWPLPIGSSLGFIGFRQAVNPGVVAMNPQNGALLWTASHTATGELTGPPAIAAQGS